MMKLTPMNSTWTNDDPLDWVNPLCGTDSDRMFSTGLTYPAIGRPWGMTYFSPRNCVGGQVFARRRSLPVNRINGFTATHAPSPWMGDYGSFTVMPSLGHIARSYNARSNSYRLDTEYCRPDVFAANLISPSIHCELTATSSCGLLRVIYPRAEDACITLQLSSANCEMRQVGNCEIEGAARDGHSLAEGYACRFVIKLDRPITDTHIIPAENNLGEAMVLRFDTTGNTTVIVTMATSFISHEQARLNSQRELRDRSFDAVRQETGDCWREELNRIRVTGGSDDQRRTFYTCLWRTLLFPRTLTEIIASGDAVHYSPYTDRIEHGTLVTDNGFWDTSRTVYPLLSLVWRKRLGVILDGWLNAYRQSGWMPQWASPGHRACMVGTHSAAVFCDAILKKIAGFDHREAFESMVKDATVPGDPHARWGRQQLPEYIRLGYCPEDGDIDSVSRTLDYSYNDWCCARVAEVFGEYEQTEQFNKRSSNWKNLFDPQIKFFRPRHSDGRWLEPFEEFRWGGPYREGGPWQYRFGVLHDPEGLAEAFGGISELITEIRRMFNIEPHFTVGSYGQQIHEMVEMAAANMGQYSHSNQPVHGVLGIPARLDDMQFTDYAIRKVLTTLYSPEVFPGDEDNGEMGAWYVLGAIGLFAHCPGDPAFTLIPPIFDTVELHGDDGQIIKLKRHEQISQRPITIAYESLFEANGDFIRMP